MSQVVKQTACLSNEGLITNCWLTGKKITQKNAILNHGTTHNELDLLDTWPGSVRTCSLAASWSPTQWAWLRKHFEAMGSSHCAEGKQLCEGLICYAFYCNRQQRGAEASCHLHIAEH